MKTLPNKVYQFQQVYQRKGMPKEDLFASRLSHQLLQYFAWWPNPFSQGTDALQQIWGNQSLYISIPLYISSILLFSTSLEESQVRPNREQLLVTPIRQSQIWYTLILEKCIAHPLLLPRNTSLKIPQGEIHPLNGNRTLRLAMWTRSGKDYLRRYDTIKNCRWNFFKFFWVVHYRR